MSPLYKCYALLILTLCTEYLEANRPPTFTKTIDLAVIKENTPIGTVVFQLEGYDPENSSLTFGLEGTEYLAVDKHNGLVTVAQPIDREEHDNLQFFVTLEDVVGKGQKNNLVREPVTVIIIDENDNPPVFLDQPYKVSVREDAVPGFTVLDDIKITDADDVGGVLQIRCEFYPQSPDGCERFSVAMDAVGSQSSVASLVLRKSLDYSERSNYRLRLVADDGRYNSTASVEISVVDVQNRPPVFVGSLTAIVDEDVPVDTLVMRVVAKDGDEGNRRNITYELISNLEEFFSVDPNSGELRTAKILDREIFASSNGVVSLAVKATEVPMTNEKDVSLNEIEEESSWSSVALSVTIRDANDEAPAFNKVSYTVHVNENVADGTPLPNLDMFVQDTDTGSNSVFNLELMDDSSIFSVEPLLATGSTSVSIRVANGPLDYENPNQRKFILLVVAKEAFTNPRLSSTGTVTVIVTDTNDNSPIFEKSEYRAVIAETSPPGTVVDTITASDRDTMSFGEAGIIYSLFGNGAERFSVGTSSGVITVAGCETPGHGNCLDFETRPAYYLSYQAVDEDGRGHAAVVPLTITLADVNDNAPAFLHESYSATIDEGATKFDTPLRVQAVDADATSVLRYSIIAGDPGKLFIVDGRSGEISVTNPAGLDVSAVGSNIIVLTVLASDEGKGNVTTTVTVTVKDANNNSPVFQKESYIAVVSESSPPGTVVEQVSADDADTGVNAEIFYRIQRGAFDDFELDSGSGLVTVSNTARLDYDRRNIYNIEIIAVDKGSPVHTGTTTLMVHVLNSNDKVPYFTPSTQRTQVTEGEGVGYMFYRLKAQDPDVSGPDALTFSVGKPVTAIDKDGRALPDRPDSAYQDFFSVDEASGEVRVASRLDRELAAIVTLTVLVVDNSASPPQTGTGTLVVTIVDLNDFPPSFGRPWTPERPELSLQVMEEQPIGSVVATLVATDQDSNIASYIIEPENPYFDIGSTSGVLSVKSRVDYEQVRQIEFRVLVKDTGIPQLSAEALVTAHVLNINDNDPTFDRVSYEASLPENSPQGTEVVTVKAIDADAGDFGRIRYSLIGEKSLDFAIDQEGVIRVAAAATLDREVTPSVTLQVVATDQGSDQDTRRAVSVPVYVSLEDVNDNPPVFSQREYEGTVVAGSPLTPPSTAAQLFAEDRDRDSNAKIRFSIVAGNDKGTFTINKETGVIYAAKEIEEGVKSYKLKVQADNGESAGGGIDEAIVRIKVIEINREKPKFIVPALPNATAELPENQSIRNYLVLQVMAEDNDRGENGRVSYYLKIGDANVEETEEFHINTITGELRTKMHLDREKTPRYQLVLVARDNGSPVAFESLRFLTVILKDVDDNDPQFPRTQSTDPYVFTLEENLPVNFPIGQVVAEDKDVGENALVFYYIVDGNYGGSFRVEKTSGLIKSNTTFDREQRDSYEIVIKASSDPDFTVYARAEEPGFSAAQRSYRVEDKSLALVRIIVSDVNDNPPRFIDEPYLSGVRVTTQTGDSVLSVMAVDLDSGENGAFEYRLENVRLFRPGQTGSVRPVPSPFEINADGHLLATQLMARYDHARFEVVIAAREVATPFRTARTTAKLWVYEPNQLIRVILSQPPEEVNNNKALVNEILSNATRGAVVIDDIRYHVNEKNTLMRKWYHISLRNVELFLANTFIQSYAPFRKLQGKLLPIGITWRTDLFVHVVNDQDEMMLTSQVLEAVDSNSELLSAHRDSISIHKIVPAYVDLLQEELDIALLALISLLVVLFVGFITMIVCCMCLKKWYSTKMHETLVRHDEAEAGNTTENPLWTEQKLKLYEEQELSMTVSPDQQQQAEVRHRQLLAAAEVAAANDSDADSAMYATLRKSTAGSTMGTFRQHQRQQQPVNNEYATLNGCYSGDTQNGSTRNRLPPSDFEETSIRRDTESPEYHELQCRRDERVSPVTAGTPAEDEVVNSGLTISNDGEPVLIAELL